jgi:hypothetical protein
MYYSQSCIAVIGVLMMAFMIAGEAVAQSKCVPTPIASCDDQARFELIKQYGQVIRTQSIWKGRFNFQELPLYIVHWDEKNANKGFLLNAPVNIKGATKLPPEISHGNRILRYDGSLEAAAKIPNQLFEMPFKIGETPYFLMLYKDWDASDIYAIPTDEWIRILLHESFHMYQFQWVYPAYGEQDDANYPFTRDVIALSLLELNIVSAGFKTNDNNTHRSLLKMYTAVRKHKIDIEPGGKELVKNMDNVQEYLEGSAKYFEVKVYEQYHPRFPQEHFAFEIDDALDVGFQNRDEAKDFFTFGMWYFTGAIVLRMLDNIGVPFVLEMENGATPYDIAQSQFKLSPKDIILWLERAKQKFKFSDLEKQAQHYIGLKGFGKK